MKKVILPLCIMILMPSISYGMYGAMDAGSLNSNYVRDLRLHEATTRVKNKSAIVKQEKSEAPKKIDNPEIQSVIFVNNRAIPSSYLQKAVDKEINKPMTPENILQIRKDVMRYYQSLGYYSAVAMVVSQNAETGEVVIDVNEGTKNSITVE